MIKNHLMACILSDEQIESLSTFRPSKTISTATISCPEYLFCGAGGEAGGMASLLVQECLNHSFDASSAVPTSIIEWRSAELDALACEIMEDVKQADGPGETVVTQALLAKLVAGSSGVSLLQPQALESVLTTLLTVLEGEQLTN